MLDPVRFAGPEADGLAELSDQRCSAATGPDRTCRPYGNAGQPAPHLLLTPAPQTLGRGDPSLANI
jgi:hypothetical protein